MTFNSLATQCHTSALCDILYYLLAYLANSSARAFALSPEEDEKEEEEAGSWYQVLFVIRLVAHRR